MTKSNNILGIDMGGTNVRGGWVQDNHLSGLQSEKINAYAAAEDVRDQLFSFTDKLINESVTAIGIGVPGLTDTASDMVYDVVNIPSWKKVPLKKWMEERYNIPVSINNDANCFALGEFYFGNGKGCSSMVGLTMGTGLGSGIIINKKLYSGRNGGAGEFGMAAYLDQCYEYYASGQFFTNVYNISGEQVYLKAKDGDAEALRMYGELGLHLGNVIKMILFSLDIEMIVIGGSVRHAFDFFKEAMWHQIKTFPFTRALEHLKFETSQLENAGVLGAAALCYE